MRPSLLATITLAHLTVPSTAHAQSNEAILEEINALKERLSQLEKILVGNGKTDKQSPKKKLAKKTAEIEIHKLDPAPSLRTSDGNFSFNPRGRLFIDWGTGSDDEGLVDFDGTEIRAAWFGIDGSIYKNLKYKFEADFGGNKVSVKDAYIGFKYGGLSYTIGQSKVPNSLEWQTAISQTTFMERAGFKDAFGIGRRMGIKVSKSEKNWGVSGGVFRGTNSNASDTEGWLLALRAQAGNSFDNGRWMIGGSFRIRDEKGAAIRYRARPVHHLAPRLVDVTGTDKDTLFAGETALTLGSIFAAAEYNILQVRDSSISNETPTFKGGYAEIGWNITGEARPLNIGKGTFGRAKVDAPLFKGGLGLWQVALRYDSLDLTDDVLIGGQQNSWVLGLSWYPNRYSRILVNYGHSEISDLLSPDNSVDTFGLRMNLDW